MERRLCVGARVLPVGDAGKGLAAMNSLTTGSQGVFGFEASGLWWAYIVGGRRVEFPLTQASLGFQCSGSEVYAVVGAFGPVEVSAYRAFKSSEPRNYSDSLCSAPRAAGVPTMLVWRVWTNWACWSGKLLLFPYPVSCSFLIICFLESRVGIFRGLWCLICPCVYCNTGYGWEQYCGLCAILFCMAYFI